MRYADGVKRRKSIGFIRREDGYADGVYTTEMFMTGRGDFVKSYKILEAIDNFNKEQEKWTATPLFKMEDWEQFESKGRPNGREDYDWVVDRWVRR